MLASNEFDDVYCFIFMNFNREIRNISTQKAFPISYKITIQFTILERMKIQRKNL